MILNRIINLPKNTSLNIKSLSYAIFMLEGIFDMKEPNTRITGAAISGIQIQIPGICCINKTK